MSCRRRPSSVFRSDCDRPRSRESLLAGGPLEPDPESCLSVDLPLAVSCLEPEALRFGVDGFERLDSSDELDPEELEEGERGRRLDLWRERAGCAYAVELPDGMGVG